MGYQLIFSGANEEEKKSAEENHMWPQEIIEITPPLTDTLMAAMELMRGQAGGCHATGAEVINVSPNKITIASCCDGCKTALVKQIINSLGKKIIIQVD